MMLRWATAVLIALLLPPKAAAAQDVTLVTNLDSAWSAVSRTYWDTALVNGRWRAAYDSLRPLAAKTQDEAELRRLIRALIAVPAVSHMVLIPRSDATRDVAEAGASATGGASGPRERVPGTAGLELRMIGDTLVAWRVDRDGPAARAGIGAGAIIRAIGKVTTDSLRALARLAVSDDVERSRRLTNTLALRIISGDAGDTLRLVVGAERGRRERTVTLVRSPLVGQSTKFGSLPTLIVSSRSDSVSLPGHAGRAAALISFSAWFPVIAPELDARLFAARGAPGVILDLRGNPGGVVGMLAGISGHFLDSAVALGTMRARGATIRFVANPRRVDRAGERQPVITAPLAILVDGYTGSTSEFFASGMQALGRARVFGVSSAGEALPAVMAALPNGDVLMHAIADHEDARGRRVEGVGVLPDEPTPLRRDDLLAGRDAALEAARRWLARPND